MRRCFQQILKILVVKHDMTSDREGARMRDPVEERGLQDLAADLLVMLLAPCLAAKHLATLESVHLTSGGQFVTCPGVQFCERPVKEPNWHLWSPLVVAGFV